MSELDRLKERVAYLKYAQGAFIFIDLGLAGWLLSASEEPSHLITLALLGILVLSFGIMHLHRQIERCIDQIGKL